MHQKTLNLESDYEMATAILFNCIVELEMVFYTLTVIWQFI